jgi:DNA-binding response OmpR family regulator
MRLLVDENDPALATFLHSSFDAEHYTVDLTRNGEEAKQMVEERSYDLAIRRNEPAHAGNQTVEFHRQRPRAAAATRIRAGRAMRVRPKRKRKPEHASHER